MPDRPRRRCTADPTCPRPALPGGRCTLHAAAAEAQRNRRRATSRDVYQSKKWKKLRLRILNQRPYCQHPDCNLPATDVDHVRPIEDGGPAWDEANLQSLCHPHHSQKTAAENRFGGAHG